MGNSKSGRRHERFITSIMPVGAIAGGAMVAAFSPAAGLVVAYSLYRAYRVLKSKDDAEMAEARKAEKLEFTEKFYARQDFADYDSYLASSIWKAKRNAIVQRAVGRCEAPNCRSALDEVRHLRYPRIWGSEPLTSLIGLCAAHHRVAHQGQKP